MSPSIAAWRKTRTALDSLGTRLEHRFPTEDERHRLLHEWNDTAWQYPADRCIHHLVEEQVARTPDHVAVIDGDHQLTYAQLDARANGLAYRLIKAGVGPGTPVGLCVPRSPEMVVAVLAILKAGGAYVPLDPGYPPERLTFMLADSGAAALVARPGATPAAFTASVPLFELDGYTRPTTFGPCPAVGPDDLAFVIYTSGSTGQPKGVAVRHRSLVNLLVHFGRLLEVKATDRLLALAPLSFDMATFDILLPLVTGASVIVGDASAGADRLRDAIEATHPTILQTTPTLWRLLVETGWEGSPTLTAISGGEALSASLARDLMARCGAVWNGYGPCETTIYSTVARVRTPADLVTIGRPIANTEVYVLGDHRELLPVGAVGELYIGGDGLAAGYVGRPDLTAERFVEHELEPGRTTILYRTGDRVRYRDDGEIEFIGRTDDQVKIRGVRVEPGEIAARLADHPAIAHAAVVAREGHRGELQLVAYVVPATTDQPEDTALRSFLARSLTSAHAPGRVRVAARAAAHAERQDRPQGAGFPQRRRYRRT